MSFENKNLYHLLGNDVEDDEVPQLPVKEVVKKNTSSKKADVAPASADPAKAKKKAKVTGNEGALKSKNDNKDVAAPSSTPAKHQKKPFDRHSRTAKTDSKKKLKQGWGESEDREAEGEVEGEADANAELAAEDAEEDAEPEVAKRSLQDYFAELQLKQQELGASKQVRKANEGAEEKWTAEEILEKRQAAFVESTAAKKSKAKAAKEKKFLEIEAHFADETPQQSRGSFRGDRGSSRGSRGTTRGGRGASRGSTRGARGGASTGAKKADNGKKFDEQNFPSL
ncbi:Stm1-domain-containing protein [Scheffersomyces amazonensis]|uniref:Stm1-domain-containing protein n=1 Tax=Scheffersomyces amazonensis TaxID=1078765 RepID=UPI00315D6043